MPQELVLVVKRKVFEEVGAFQGLCLEVQSYLDRFFVRGVPRFIPRSLAEDDPTFKQLIPYVVMTCNGRCLSYVRGRRAGEQRLVGLRSIGIGGHVNPADDMPLLCDTFQQAYLSAVDREVAEEVNVDTGHSDRVVALINDDSTEVGKVHLGIVHHWQLEEANVSKREQMMTQLAFLTPAELEEVRESMESWSQLCLDHLRDLTAPGT